MIFDRTQNDVDTAISIIENKVKKFQPLTEKDIESLEKGTITINTLNRIEEKQSYLSNILNSYGYKNIITTKSWTYTDIFDNENMTRLLDNLKTFYELFKVYKTTPEIPLSIFSFGEVNDVEKFLYDLESVINNMINSFVFLGNEYSLGGL